MKQTKHTPGPWTVYTPPEMIHMRTIIVGPKYMIQNVLPQDARLIAAAPELLEALESLLTINTSSVTPSLSLVSKTLNEARNAINKARGES